MLLRRSIFELAFARVNLMLAGEAETWISIRFPVNFLIWVLLCPSDMFIGCDWLPEYEKNGTLDCCARSVYSKSSWAECSRKLRERSRWEIQERNKNSMKTFFIVLGSHRTDDFFLPCWKSALNDRLLSRIQTENCNSAWFMWYPLWLHNWSGSNNNRMPLDCRIVTENIFQLSFCGCS